MPVERAPFGTLPDGRGVEVVTLSSDAVTVSLLSLGAAIHRVRLPGPVDGGAGRGAGMVDVHLFHPTLGGYADRSTNPHLGASIGRYANRIAGACFPLDGQMVELAANDGPNQLHGGPDGFDRRLWSVGRVAGDPVPSVTFALHSPDGDQGFPGAVDATATFALDGPTLTVAYAATTDTTTVVNLTNHGYWNLAGVEPARSSPIDGMTLAVAADRYLPTGDDGIPSGGLALVDGTSFDLRAPQPLGDRHLDHCFAVDGPAVLAHPASGRTLAVTTDRPGLQVYTGDHLHPPFAAHGSVSLESQAFPDTPNRPDLGSARLDPGDRYQATTTFTFGAGLRC